LCMEILLGSIHGSFLERLLFLETTSTPPNIFPQSFEDMSVRSPPQAATSRSPLPKSGHRRGARNPRACNSCRQVKLRCDNVQTFPSPCSRCKRGNLQCRTDPDFKRTRARQQLDEVTSQLNAIKEALKTNSMNLSPHTRTVSTSGPESWPEPGVADPNSRSHDDTSISMQEDDFYRISLNENLPDMTLSLGSAVFELEILIILFTQ